MRLRQRVTRTFKPQPRRSQLLQNCFTCFARSWNPSPSSPVTLPCPDESCLAALFLTWAEFLNRMAETVLLQSIRSLVFFYYTAKSTQNKIFQTKNIAPAYTGNCATAYNPALPLPPESPLGAGELFFTLPPNYPCRCRLSGARAWRGSLFSYSRSGRGRRPRCAARAPATGQRGR